MIRTERLLLRRFRQSDYHSAIWVPVDMFFCTGEDMDSFFLGQNKKMNVRTGKHKNVKPCRENNNLQESRIQT